jgi:rRNA pseudouridine-1189 N-methylase Emg1 (Nep1/Mra1 family)
MVKREVMHSSNYQQDLTTWSVCSRVCYNFYMAQIISPNLIPRGRKTPVRQALQQAVTEIVSTLNPVKIILFGSFAYGKPTLDCDVDLLIILKTDLAPQDRSW